jgi:hypothetical protein
MNALTVLMIGVMTILIGSCTWDPFVTTFVQKTNAVYEHCNNSSGNNSTISCTGSPQPYKDVTIDYLFQRNIVPTLNHSDTATINMKGYQYNNKMPFILPFP